MKRWLRIDSLFGDFLLFSCQWFLRGCTCPSYPCLWGLGGRDQGRRNNESSRRLQGIQRLQLCRGSLPLYTPTLVLQRSKETTLTTGTRPPVTSDSPSKGDRGLWTHLSEPFGYSALQVSRVQRSWLSTELGPNRIVSVYQHIVTFTDTQNKIGQLFPQ